MNEIQVLRGSYLPYAALPDFNQVKDYLFFGDTSLAPADVILIFGNRHICKIAAQKAADVYGQGRASLIIASGGVRLADANYRTEAEVIERQLLASGVPKQAILLENSATNTLQNVCNSRRLVKQTYGMTDIGVICISHIINARRSLMTMGRHWWEALPMGLPINPTEPLYRDGMKIRNFKNTPWPNGLKFKITWPRAISWKPIFLNSTRVYGRPVKTPALL